MRLLFSSPLPLPEKLGIVASAARSAWARQRVGPKDWLGLVCNHQNLGGAGPVLPLSPRIREDARGAGDQPPSMPCSPAPPRLGRVQRCQYLGLGPGWGYGLPHKHMAVSRPCSSRQARKNPDWGEGQYNSELSSSTSGDPCWSMACLKPRATRMLERVRKASAPPCKGSTLAREVP